MLILAHFFPLASLLMVGVFGAVTLTDGLVVGFSVEGSIIGL